MPRSSTITLRVLVACASLFACAHTRPTPQTTTRAELRAEIDHYNCARWDPEAREWALLLLDEQCRAPATTPLARAVAAAIAEARGVRFLASIEIFYYDTLARTPSPTHATANALARASFWRDPALTRAALGRAHAQLDAHQIRCDDCQAPPAPAPRTVDWTTFFPYLAAFVWASRPEASGRSRSTSAPRSTAPPTCRPTSPSRTPLASPPSTSRSTSPPRPRSARSHAATPRAPSPRSAARSPAS